MRDICEAAQELSRGLWHAPEPIRAITVTALYITEASQSYRQIDLLDPAAQEKNERQEKLESAMDAIRSKYGKGAITFGKTGKFGGWDD